MSHFVSARFVLAVRDLAVSTRFFTETLGFRKDPIDAKGWSFLSRDTFKVMLGECSDEIPAGETGNHSWFATVIMERLDDYHREISSRGAEVISPPADKDWGLREFAVRTPDGHRIVFAEPVQGEG